MELWRRLDNPLILAHREGDVFTSWSGPNPNLNFQESEWENLGEVDPNLELQKLERRHLEDRPQDSKLALYNAFLAAGFSEAQARQGSGYANN